MIPRLLAITDPRYTPDHLARVIASAAAALPPEALGVIVRDVRPATTPEDVIVAARALRAVTRRHRSLLLVRADPDVARACDADGVHLGGPIDAARVRSAREILGAAAFVSVPAHDDAEVRVARDVGASAVLVSPIFDSPGKAPARGISALSAARRLAGPELGVYALGGVMAVDARRCFDAGADGVAVIRALFDAEDPAELARALST